MPRATLKKACHHKASRNTKNHKVVLLFFLNLTGFKSWLVLFIMACISRAQRLNRINFSTRLILPQKPDEWILIPMQDISPRSPLRLSLRHPTTCRALFPVIPRFMRGIHGYD
jgi:hypothetical protein